MLTKFRELTTWSYQHSTSIKSTHLFSDSLIVNDFFMTSNKFDSNTFFAIVVINNHRIEIYLCEFLGHEPLLSFQFDSSIRVHSIRNGALHVLTNNSLLCSIVQQSNSDEVIEFKQTDHIPLKISCSMMFSTIVTLDSIEYLVIFSDNLQTITVLVDRDMIIYIDIHQKQYFTSTYLKSISTEQNQDSILLHFDNRFLVLCQIELDKFKKNGSVNIIPLNIVDLFCLKKNCLATVNNEQNRINVLNIYSRISRLN
ncbi:unnamed protein product [Rotaria sp. Silwood2]|nr:unnamed protein product [Rotaria sp. Silwood2]CAF4453656.1 unnamed protein product [Rotaria sp. Silwood2]